MKKENLKNNVVNAPTLFVGVGGTGCKIVCRVANMCQPGETENMNFVCMDTNVNDLMEVQKCKTYVYTIQTSTTQTVGDYLDYDQDALKNWFPKNAVMYDKTVSEGAGQVRAISRLALNSTIKTGEIKPLYDAIDELYRKDGKAFQQAIRICVVSTSSGGTGSGIVLPLSMMLRDYIKNKYTSSNPIIRMMLLLPETLDSVITSEVERESQRSNAYATVKEINAFMVKGSGNCDTEGKYARYKDLHMMIPVTGSNELKKLSLLPCDWCFLFDGQNAEDNTLVNKNQYMDQAAQALYEQNIGPMMGSAFSIEDNIVAEVSKEGNDGRNRFAGIGASVLRYPYEQVAEYVAYNWTLNNIGGAGEAAKWTKYDEEFRVKEAKAKKMGLVGDDAPKIEEEYVALMDAQKEQDPFTKEIFDADLSDADIRIKTYCSSLEGYIVKSIFSQGGLSKVRAEADNQINQRSDYKQDPDKRADELPLARDTVRTFEAIVNKAEIEKKARGISNALFSNESHTVNAKDPYMLEALMKNIAEEVCHPNAARYLLYSLCSTFLKKKAACEKNIRKARETLALFSTTPNAGGTINTITDADNDVSGKTENSTSPATDIFDVKKTKKIESSLDDMVTTCITGKYDQIATDDLIQNLTNYFNAVDALAKNLACKEAYDSGYEFVRDASNEFKKFFDSFSGKVQIAERKREDIVDDLQFQKGDSVLNICANKAVLDELTTMTLRESGEGAALISDLNGAIFDAIKANVAYVRKARLDALTEKDSRVDIFDNIMIGYFLDQVKSQCHTIDMNIIEAIAMEYRMQERIKQRETDPELGKDDKKEYRKIAAEEIETYIGNVIERGKRLAAPGIQKMLHEEPRTIECCAYNKSLEDMRAYRVNDLIEIREKKKSDSVSKYELRFFNAIYNIMPQKLKKFAPHKETETGEKDAGLYHNAYVKHSRKIGPDSTKNATISKHIDKRWDSIAVMPEIDDNYQKQHMLKIHQAMVYGLLYGTISSRKMSPIAGEGRRVYRYENTDERFVNLTVSNGTLCDEFFEILDSLYISSAIVEDIMKSVRDKRAADNDHNANFCDTTFAKCLKEFSILPVAKGRTGHDGAASIFEIPMYYYNSLPNSKRYNDEINDLVEAVVKTLKDEIFIFENSEDAKFVLCTELYHQFRLLMDHYESMPNLRNNLDACDNPVLDIIYRKIKSVFLEEPQPESCDEKLEAMKARIRTTQTSEPEKKAESTEA